jgi:hypothetical protein
VPLDSEQLAVRIDLRVAELRVLAAQAARDYWREYNASAWHLSSEQRIARAIYRAVRLKVSARGNKT